MEKYNYDISSIPKEQERNRIGYLIVPKILCDSDTIKIYGTPKNLKRDNTISVDYYTFLSLSSFKTIDFSELNIENINIKFSLDINNASKIEHIILPNNFKYIPHLFYLRKKIKITGMGIETVFIHNTTPGEYYIKELEIGPHLKKIIIFNTKIEKLTLHGIKSNFIPYSLAYNEKLKQVHLPDNINTIPRRLFEGCSNLEIITGGNSIKSIGNCAFGGCTKLKEVPFPSYILRDQQFLTELEFEKFTPSTILYRWLNLYRNHTPYFQEFSDDKEYSEGIGSGKYDNCTLYKRGVVVHENFVLCLDNGFYYKGPVELKKHFMEIIHFNYPSYSFTEKNSEETIINHPLEKLLYIKDKSFTNTMSDDNYVPLTPSEIEQNYVGCFKSYTLMNDDTYILKHLIGPIDYISIIKEISHHVNQTSIKELVDSYYTKYDENYITKIGGDNRVHAYLYQGLKNKYKYTKDTYIQKLLPTTDIRYDDSGYTAYFSGLFRLREDMERLKKEESKIKKDAIKKYDRKDHFNALIEEKITKKEEERKRISKVFSYYVNQEYKYNKLNYQTYPPNDELPF